MIKKCHRFLIVALTVCHGVQQIFGDSNDSDIDAIPETGFDCKTKGPGFYADPHPSTLCKVYHLCTSRGKKTSFICPKGTLFHQQYLICAHKREVNCSVALKYYNVNEHAFPPIKTSSSLPLRPGPQVTPSPPLPTLPSLPPEPFPRLTSFQPARHPKTTKSKPFNSANSATVQEWPPRNSFIVSTLPTTRRQTPNNPFPAARLTTTSLETRRNQAALPPFPTTTKPISPQKNPPVEVKSRWSLPVTADFPAKKSTSGIINRSQFPSINKKTTPNFTQSTRPRSKTSSAVLPGVRENVDWTESSTRSSFPVTTSRSPNTANQWENVNNKNHKELTMIFPKKAKVVDPSLPVNDLCPLCDPYFLEPGTCMPCVIIR